MEHIDTHIVELAFGLLATALIGTLGYFLKRSLSEVTDVRKNLNEKIERIYGRIDGLARDLENTFNRICHERQHSCSMLTNEKIDRVQSQVEAACKKIANFESRQQRKWEKQSELNSKLNGFFNGNRRKEGSK